VADSDTASIDALVIGAGAWGLTAAWSLAAEGRRVTVADDGGPAAGEVAAGMLCPWSEAEDDGSRDLFDAFRASAREWPAFAGTVEAASGCLSGYHRCGSVYVASRPEHVGAVRRIRDTLAHHGFDRPWLPLDDLRDVEPGLGPSVSGGIALDDEHQTEPARLMVALRAACARAGVTFEPAVTSLDAARSRARMVVLAAGHASGELSRRIATRPVKGEILVLAPRPDAPCPLRRIVRSPGAYLVPRPDGRVTVGATSIEASDRDPTAEGTLWLLEEAIRLAPGLAEMRLLDVSAGLRPATADLRPALGPDETGLVWATGGYRHGVLLLPLVAAAMRAAAHGEAPPAATAGFTPTRFAEPACV
jgi:glycine oxidase